MAIPDPTLTPGCAGSCGGPDRTASDGCALSGSCDVLAGRAAPNLSQTLALCEAVLGGEGALWLEDRPGPSWTTCAPLRHVAPAVVEALRRAGIFDAEGWPPVRPAEGLAFCAAAPLRPSLGEPYGLLVVSLPDRAAASFEPDVLRAVARVLADQVKAEEEGCLLRRSRHSSEMEVAAFRTLLRERESRAADDVQRAASLLFLDAMSGLSGATTSSDSTRPPGSARGS